MPRNEFDFEDPLELNGVVFVTPDDTADAMCECFIEEFMRMGHNPKQVLALFRNPHYLGMNMVLRKRGEQFIREQIAAVFLRWGREVAWGAEQAHRPRLDLCEASRCPGGCISEDAKEQNEGL